MKLLLKLSILLFCLPAFAQTGKNLTSLASAYKLAADQEKLIVLIVSSPRPSTHPGVTEYLKTLKNKEIATLLDKNFIRISANSTDPEIKKIVNKYVAGRFPAFLFLNADGDLIYKDFGSSAHVPKYLSMINRALAAAEKPSLSDFKEQYQTRKTDLAFIKSYIDTKRGLGMTDNQDLIEDYVKQLTIKDLSDYKTVLYILEAGPVAYGTAYNMAFTHKFITDSIYKSEPLERRMAINNIIIKNTMTKAIQSKNVALAQFAANFSRGTQQKKYHEGQKHSNEQLLYYYKAVKDSSAYLKMAMSHYDIFYMRLSADSIKKLDQQSITAARKQNMEKNFPRIETKNSSHVSKIVSRQTYHQMSTNLFTGTSIASTLNNAAYSIYSTGTKNPEYLSKALLWTKRALELRDVYGYYSTQAHLLYRLGYYHEAEHAQLQSIEKAKKGNMKYDFLEKAYKAMKERTL